jgi:hypothetical protein
MDAEVIVADLSWQRWGDEAWLVDAGRVEQRELTVEVGVPRRSWFTTIEVPSGVQANAGKNPLLKPSPMTTRSFEPSGRTTTMATSCADSARRIAICRPSGEKIGRVSFVGPVTIAVDVPVTGSPTKMSPSEL